VVYTLVLGILIIKKRISPNRTKLKKLIPPLAVFLVVMDSVDWRWLGIVCASTLIAGGHSPRFTIGSINPAGFFYCLAQFAYLFYHDQWQNMAGLILGGITDSHAANLSRKKPARKGVL